MEGSLFIGEDYIGEAGTQLYPTTTEFIDLTSTLLRMMSADLAFNFLIELTSDLLQEIPLTSEVLTDG